MRDVIALVQSIEVPVVGADVVELNPRQDDGDLTARVAAKLVKELLARLLTAGERLRIGDAHSRRTADGNSHQRGRRGTRAAPAASRMYKVQYQ